MKLLTLFIAMQSVIAQPELVKNGSSFRLEMQFKDYHIRVEENSSNGYIEFELNQGPFEKNRLTNASYEEELEILSIAENFFNENIARFEPVNKWRAWFEDSRKISELKTLGNVVEEVEVYTKIGFGKINCTTSAGLKLYLYHHKETFVYSPFTQQSAKLELLKKLKRQDSSIYTAQELLKFPESPNIIEFTTPNRKVVISNMSRDSLAYVVNNGNTNMVFNSDGNFSIRSGTGNINFGGFTMTSSDSAESRRAQEEARQAREQARQARELARQERDQAREIERQAREFARQARQTQRDLPRQTQQQGTSPTSYFGIGYMENRGGVVHVHRDGDSFNISSNGDVVFGCYDNGRPVGIDPNTVPQGYSQYSQTQTSQTSQGQGQSQAQAPQTTGGFFSWFKRK